MPRHLDQKDRVTKLTGADGTELTVTDTGFVAAAVGGAHPCVGSTWMSFHRGMTPTDLTVGHLMKSSFFATVADAQVHVDVLAAHWVEADALGRCRAPSLARTARGGRLRTPDGGDAESATAYGKGVAKVDSAGHGWFRLTPEANARVPEPLRIEDGWYEEDQDWARVAHAFPDLFTAYERDCAKVTLRNWEPDGYAAATGETVAVEESLVLRRRAFEAEHADSIRVTSATMDRERPGMVVVTARRGGRDGEGPYRTFLVPQAEYDARTDEFVIDESRHEEPGAAPVPGM